MAQDNRNLDVSNIFQNRRKKVLGLAVPYILVVVFILILQLLGIKTLCGIDLKYIVFAYVGAAALFLIVVRKNWRCPACDEIPGRDHNPRFCRNCGAKLH